MINKIYKFINKFNMLEDCSDIVLGLSGGADSVCLLIVLKKIIEEKGLKIGIRCIHVNHMIRGGEALRDQEFSRELCESLNVPFFVVSENVMQTAKDNGLTIEEAGRIVRYKAFEECASGLQNAKIAVAHHMNDEAETVLMNILRGSSIKGASGILPVRDNIIRPLLCVTRREIETFLEKEGQEYVTDSTNNDVDYTRNKLRNELIPYIKSNFNNNLERNIADMASDFAQVWEFVEDCSKALWQRYVKERTNGSIAIENLGSFSKENAVLQRQVISNVFKALSVSQKDIYRKHIEIVLEAEKMQVGKSVNLPYGICCKKSYDELIFEVHNKKKAEEGILYKNTVFDDIDKYLKEQGKYTIPLDCMICGEGNLPVKVENITFEIIKFKENLSGSIYTKYFDYDKIKRNLCVRFEQKGDYLTINKQGQTKSLKKEFADKKIPGHMRDSILLVADEQTVLWAVAVRRSESAYVDGMTKRILKVSVKTY